VNIVLLAVGRVRKGPEQALFDAYAKRLRWSLTVREVEVRKPLPAAERRTQEGRLLLEALPPRAHAIVLDEGGRTLSSEAFARHMGTRRDDGGGDPVALLIGGADGHDDAVKARADLLLSLGPMTWPHLLVRALLAEQLYRAQAILDGHPYHRA
jgi:23S rRNA (pseudouridine1915-N3)-methyltransferase